MISGNWDGNLSIRKTRRHYLIPLCGILMILIIIIHPVSINKVQTDPEVIAPLNMLDGGVEYKTRLSLLNDTLSMFIQDYESLGYLGEELPPSLKAGYYFSKMFDFTNMTSQSLLSNHLSWLESLLYNVSETGIVPNPHNDTVTLNRVQASAMTIITLYNLDNDYDLNRTALINFFNNSFVPSVGGFSGTLPAVVDDIDVETTLFAIEALYALNAISEFNSSLMLEYLQGCQNINQTDPHYGGLSFSPLIPATQYTTWRILDGFRILGVPLWNESSTYLNLTALDIWINTTLNDSQGVRWTATNHLQSQSTIVTSLGIYNGRARNLLSNTSLSDLRSILSDGFTAQGDFYIDLNQTENHVTLIWEIIRGLLGYVDPPNLGTLQYEINSTYFLVLEPVINRCLEFQHPEGGIMTIHPEVGRLEPTLWYTEIVQLLENFNYTKLVNTSNSLDWIKRTYHDGAHWAFLETQGIYSQVPGYQYQWQKNYNDAVGFGFNQEILNFSGWPGTGILQTALVKDLANTTIIWNSTQETEIINTILNSQYFDETSSDGGFTSYYPPFSISPLLLSRHINLETSLAAIGVLDRLNATSMLINRSAIIDFVLRQYFDEDHFSDQQNASISDIYATYCATTILNLLNETNQVNTTAIESWLLNQALNPENSFQEIYAISATLQQLDPVMLDSLPISQWVEYFQSTQSLEGYLEDPYDLWLGTSKFYCTYLGLKTLHLLNASVLFDVPIELDVYLLNQTLFGHLNQTISMVVKVNTSFSEISNITITGNFSGSFVNFTTAGNSTYSGIITIPNDVTYLGIYTISLYVEKPGYLSTLAEFALNISSTFEYSFNQSNLEPYLLSDNQYTFFINTRTDTGLELNNSTITVIYALNAVPLGSQVFTPLNQGNYQTSASFSGNGTISMTIIIEHPFIQTDNFTLLFPIFQYYCNPSLSISTLSVMESTFFTFNATLNNGTTLRNRTITADLLQYMDDIVILNHTYQILTDNQGIGNLIVAPQQLAPLILDLYHPHIGDMAPINITYVIPVYPTNVVYQLTYPNETLYNNSFTFTLILNKSINSLYTLFPTQISLFQNNLLVWQNYSVITPDTLHNQTIPHHVFSSLGLYTLNFTIDDSRVQIQDPQQFTNHCKLNLSYTTVIMSPITTQNMSLSISGITHTPLLISENITLLFYIDDLLISSRSTSINFSQEILLDSPLEVGWTNFTIEISGLNIFNVTIRKEVYVSSLVTFLITGPDSLHVSETRGWTFVMLKDGDPILAFSYLTIHWKADITNISQTRNVLYTGAPGLTSWTPTTPGTYALTINYLEPNSGISFNTTKLVTVVPFPIIAQIIDLQASYENQTHIQLRLQVRIYANSTVPFTISSCEIIITNEITQYYDLPINQQTTLYIWVSKPISNVTVALIIPESELASSFQTDPKAFNVQQDPTPPLEIITIISAVGSSLLCVLGVLTIRYRQKRQEKTQETITDTTLKAMLAQINDSHIATRKKLDEQVKSS